MLPVNQLAGGGVSKSADQARHGTGAYRNHLEKKLRTFYENSFGGFQFLNET